MIKKITLASVTALALMTVSAPGQGMGGNGMYMSKSQYKGMKMHKMRKKQTSSPFLIKQGLPHLTKMIMPYMNDPAFNLTPEQKTKLAAIKKETLGAVMQIKPEVMQLRKEIVQASLSGVSADTLKAKVDKLASLEAKATMVHLRCLEQTKAVLTKDQLMFLLANKGKMKKHTMKRKGMQGNKQGLDKVRMMMN